MELDKAVSSVIKSLSESREFTQLKEATRKLHQDDKSRDLLMSFNQKNIKIQELGLATKILQPSVDELDKEFEALIAVPELKDYFEKVDCFNSIMFNVIHGIRKALESELFGSEHDAPTSD
jgi:cell fate (sporulation/competence/biofilm development) regulator YlbF (YheA/YmcA/DUF963 family)